MVSKGKLDRWVKVKSRTTHMNAVRESYNPIVPQKQANEGPQPRVERGHRPEESDQERGLAKGNVEQEPTAGTQSPELKVSRGLLGVREAAEREGMDSVANMQASLAQSAVWSLLPEAGTVCGSSARTGLCGGCPVRGIPTAFDTDGTATARAGRRSRSAGKSGPNHRPLRGGWTAVRQRRALRVPQGLAPAPPGAGLFQGFFRKP
jgi:hypothetical protein